MSIGFIGAGKVGFTLAKYFAEGGLDIKGFYSLHTSSAEEGARFTDSEAFDNLDDLVSECDILFVTVPDGSIAHAWSLIRESDIRGKIICHCSGALSSEDAFAGIDDMGAFGYSVHPLFAVSDKYNAYRELSDVFFTLEGSTGKLHYMENMLRGLGNPVAIIKGEHKTKYHCAAAMASNLVCALIEESVELMTECGFARDEAVKALGPIITGNMEHIARVGPVEALTGPIERDDCQTVKKHLDLLGSAPGDRSRKELYITLSERLVNMARERHSDRDYAEMSKLLENEKGTTR